MTQTIRISGIPEKLFLDVIVGSRSQVVVDEISKNVNLKQLENFYNEVFLGRNFCVNKVQKLVSVQVYVRMYNGPQVYVRMYNGLTCFEEAVVDLF